MFIHHLGHMFEKENEKWIEFINYVFEKYNDYDKYDFQIEIGYVLSFLLQEN